MQKSPDLQSQSLPELSPKEAVKVDLRPYENQSSEARTRNLRSELEAFYKDTAKKKVLGNELAAFIETSEGAVFLERAEQIVGMAVASQRWLDILIVIEKTLTETEKGSSKYANIFSSCLLTKLQEYFLNEPVNLKYIQSKSEAKKMLDVLESMARPLKVFTQQRNAVQPLPRNLKVSVELRRELENMMQEQQRAYAFAMMLTELTDILKVAAADDLKNRNSAMVKPILFLPSSIDYSGKNDGIAVKEADLQTLLPVVHAIYVRHELSTQQEQKFLFSGDRNEVSNLVTLLEAQARSKPKLAPKITDANWNHVSLQRIISSPESVDFTSLLEFIMKAHSGNLLYSWTTEAAFLSPTAWHHNDEGNEMPLRPDVEMNTVLFQAWLLSNFLIPQGTPDVTPEKFFPLLFELIERLEYPIIRSFALGLTVSPLTEYRLFQDQLTTLPDDHPLFTKNHMFPLEDWALHQLPQSLQQRQDFDTLWLIGKSMRSLLRERKSLLSQYIENSPKIRLFFKIFEKGIEARNYPDQEESTRTFFEKQLGSEALAVISNERGNIALVSEEVLADYKEKRGGILPRADINYQIHFQPETFPAVLGLTSVEFFLQNEGVSSAYFILHTANAYPISGHIQEDGSIDGMSLDFQASWPEMDILLRNIITVTFHDMYIREEGKQRQGDSHIVQSLHRYADIVADVDEDDVSENADTKRSIPITSSPTRSTSEAQTEHIDTNTLEDDIESLSRSRIQRVRAHHRSIHFLPTILEIYQNYLEDPTEVNLQYFQDFVDEFSSQPSEEKQTETPPGLQLPAFTDPEGKQILGSDDKPLYKKTWVKAHTNPVIPEDLALNDIYKIYYKNGSAFAWLEQLLNRAITKKREE